MGSQQLQIGFDSAAEQDPAPSQALEVVVVFTDVPSTLDALRTAAQLAQGLACRIRLLAFHSVPFPLPLSEPRVSLPFLTRRFRTLIRSHAVDSEARPVETVADICLCRDACEALLGRLDPRSVVVIGRRSRWWPRPEDRLARKLRAAGHHVVRSAWHKESAHAV